eukprot:5796390-Pyramimonas_sp.AAC.1
MFVLWREYVPAAVLISLMRGPTGTCGGIPGSFHADPLDPFDTEYFGASSDLEDLPVATPAESDSDGDRVFPNRQKKPIDPMHYMTHSPKHPDCEVCSRTMAQNA